VPKPSQAANWRPRLNRVRVDHGQHCGNSGSAYTAQAHSAAERACAFASDLREMVVVLGDAFIELMQVAEQVADRCIGPTWQADLTSLGVLRQMRATPV